MGQMTTTKRSSGVGMQNPGGTLLLLKRVKAILLFSSFALVIITIVRLRGAPVDKAVPVDVEEEVFSYNRPENAPLIAIVSCIKQTGIHQPVHDIERSLLASIYATVTQKERASFRVELILGYDHDDEYWQQDRNHHLSPTKYGEIMYKDHEPIPVSFVSIHKDPNGDRPTRIPFNELCQAAYDYGATYIVRINDDSEFSTTGWITMATNALSSFNPPNVGVVGPTCHEGALDIMTHDMVHAPTHYSIFDTYYPPIFDNYYVDDWMTHAYGKERTIQLEDWVITHHLTRFWTRYEPTFHQDKLLDQLVAEGTRSVEKFLFKKEISAMNGDDPNGDRYRQRDELRILGTDIIERVDGPMQELHLSFSKKPNTQLI